MFFHVSDDVLLRINRIRLEFKVHTGNIRHRNISVLIESDWNLKWTGYQRELNKGELY